MNEPKVGVTVIIIKDSKVLLSKRKNSHGNRTWQFPGGHLEFNEEFEGCARREVLEEVGIEIKNIRPGTFTNALFKKENKHYVTIFMIADYKAGEVKNIEPDRSENWQWFSWNNMPKPLFLPIENLLKQRYNPFEKRDY